VVPWCFLLSWTGLKQKKGHKISFCVCVWGGGGTPDIHGEG
jgi:hypothetical protein